MTARSSSDAARTERPGLAPSERLRRGSEALAAPLSAPEDASAGGDIGRSNAPTLSNSRPDPGPPGAGVQPVDQPGSGLGLVVSFAVAAVVLVLAFYVAGDPRPNRYPLAQRTTTLF
ncbi:MAG: hypothetical protein M3Q10_20060, partial [Chloroflexota bacterium]|nr:hypothetical protein [Chloroflexota bacterium]